MTLPEQGGRIKRGTPEYDSVHNWVRKYLGKPSTCMDCSKTDADRYEWANISGEYKRDILDWRRMCVPCHQKYDNRGYKSHCKYGHEMTPENTYIYPTSDSGKCCRICRTRHTRDHKKRVKLRREQV